MSKSEVNLIKKFRTSKLQSETALPSLKSSMYKGKELNRDRCNNYNQIDGVKFKPKKVKPTNFYVCKLMYPEDLKYPACDHQNDFIINRQAFSKDEYVKFLSTPKKFYEKPPPKWIRRNIPPCTAYLNELSQPKKLNLINTLDEHRHHLTFARIENIKKRINFGDHQTPREVMQSLRQQLRDSKYKIKLQKCEIKKLKKKIGKSKQFKDVATELKSKLRQMILCDRALSISEDCHKLAELILPKLCQITGHEVPKKNSTNSTDKALVKLSTKFAYCVLEYLKNSCFRTKKLDDSECLRIFKNSCIPIESFYPQELKVDDSQIEDEEQTESDDDVDDEEVENMSIYDGSKESIENASSESAAKLSFLRLSQVNISMDECKQLFDAINEATEKLNEKKELKDSKRAERNEREKALAQAKAEREAERRAQEKAEAKARRKARRRKGKNACFGNLNPRPQWQVEYISKPSTSNPP